MRNLNLNSYFSVRYVYKSLKLIINTVTTLLEMDITNVLGIVWLNSVVMVKRALDKLNLQLSCG